jgi:hypothetical protein
MINYGILIFEFVERKRKMKLQYFALIISLLASTSFMTTCAQARVEKQDVRKQLDTAYSRLNDAMKQNNPTQLLTVMQDILAPGELRDQILSGIKLTIAAGGDKDLKQMITLKLEIQNLTVKGDTAKAAVSQWADVIRVDSKGLYGPKGKEHHLQGSILFEDSWVKLKDEWKLANTKPLNEKLWVDGKLWKPEKR